MTLILDKMKLEVCGVTTWACFAGKSGDEIWAWGRDPGVITAAETKGNNENASRVLATKKEADKSERGEWSSWKA